LLKVRIVLDNLAVVSTTLSLPPDTRVTPQRAAVLAAIEAAHGSFTAVEIYDRARKSAPALGLATVYRTLDLLRGAGTVRALAGAEGAVYVRCRPGHHHHLVCVSCGSVEETELCGAPAPAVLRRRHGFRAETHELDVYGVCARCA
jgi:Fur family transcriptional regulator, ferric uptake regulator